MNQQLAKQRGITSIFIVIIAALLFAIIAMSFAGLMSRDQRRSTDDELSQSAYDSAMAGVEDAKRVIMAARGGSSEAQNAIAANECDTVQAANMATGDDEVIIQSSSSGGGQQLDQAYTCVKISSNSDNYLVNLEEMSSGIVPLYGVSSFDRLTIEWHTAASTSTSIDSLCGATSVSNTPLCQPGAVAADTTPALLRANFITPGASTRLSDLNDSEASQTVFLYPVVGGAGTVAVSLDAYDRLYDDYSNSAPGSLFINKPQPITCATSFGTSGYACRAEVTLADRIDAYSALSFLRLTAIYAASDAKITLYNGSFDSDDMVQFSGVQPVVDSTGRANDLFRRVEARLSLTSDINLPEAAIDTGGRICKNFLVTPSGSAQVHTTGPCTP